MVITNFRLYENKQKAESIIKKLNIPNDNEEYLKIKELVKSKPNVFGQFVKWFFVDNTNYDTLEELFKFINMQHIKLDRPVDTFNTANDLYDYLQIIEDRQSVNKIINTLTSELKNKVKNDKKFIELLSGNLDFSAKIIEFFEDCKAYSSNSNDALGYDALFNDTYKLIENLKGEFNVDGVKNMISKGDLNIDVILEKPTLMVLNVHDYKSMKEIGNRKWCIVKSENSWDSYVNDFTKQYIIFDFTKDNVTDREHAIGITVSVNFGSEPNKFTAIHWSNDDTDGLSKEYIDELGKKHGIK